MGERLKGKVAVVTGSGQGIGRAIAIGMANEGAKVITNNRRPGTEGGDAETTAKEIKEAGGEAIPVFADISKPEEARRLIQAAVDNFGRIDILVNNAGVNRDRMIWKMSEEEWDTVIKVILYGCFYCTNRASAIMREQRSGRIINISSRLALGAVGQSNYVAAKAGILGFTRAVARDLGRYGITCNAIFPLAATRMMLAPEVLAAREKRIAAGIQTVSEAGKEELPDPMCVAPIAVYLASDEAANVNGQVFFSKGPEISLYSHPEKVKSIFAPSGIWTVEELASVFPTTLGEGLVNPAPPQP